MGLHQFGLCIFDPDRVVLMVKGPSDRLWSVYLEGTERVVRVEKDAIRSIIEAQREDKGEEGRKLPSQPPQGCEGDVDHLIP